MKPRTRNALIGFFLLAVCAIVGLWLCIPRHGINETTFDRIQRGMKVTEINRLLGAPPGDYRTREDPLMRARWGYYGWGNLEPDLLEIWESDHGRIDVNFDQNGFAQGAVFYPPIRHKSFLKIVWNWLQELY